MNENTGRSKTFGVLTTLQEEGESCRVILDDVEGAGKDGEWRKISLVTWKDFPKEKFDELSFDDKELAAFGWFVLARLKVLVHPRPLEVIDDAAVQWGREIELDISQAGSNKRISLKISEPIKSERDEHYLCLISLKGFFQSNKRIYGLDAAQARTLSIDFIRTVLQDYTVSLPSGEMTTIDALFQ